MAVMTASEFVEKAKGCANNYKTLYVMGCFGAPMNEKNKQRYTNNHSYNKQSERKAMINAATADTFGFDCICFIKSLLWGWNGNKNAVYGGAAYKSNGVPDINADSMIKKCTAVTTDFSKIQAGEYLWLEGHCGVYIGNGLAVECTPNWKNCVQITAVSNIGHKAGYYSRRWTKHGKLPYIDYTTHTTGTGSSTASHVKEATDWAKKQGIFASTDYTKTATLEDIACALYYLTKNK